jgi:hypothetical protein
MKKTHEKSHGSYDVSTDDSWSRSSSFWDHVTFNSPAFTGGAGLSFFLALLRIGGTSLFSPCILPKARSLNLSQCLAWSFSLFLLPFTTPLSPLPLRPITTQIVNLQCSSLVSLPPTLPPLLPPPGLIVFFTLQQKALSFYLVKVFLY